MISDIQSFLGVKSDGILGKKTLNAVDIKLKDSGIDSSGWNDTRKLVAVEQLLYVAKKIETGSVDGLVGPQTLYAREVYQARKAGIDVETWRDKTPPVRAKVYQRNWPTQKDVRTFYGEPGSNLVSVKPAYSMRLAWDQDTQIHSFMAHEKCKESMEAAFENVLNFYGLDEIKRLRLDLFGGCFNLRKMRGGSALSMHSWGIAIDIDPERNQLRWGRDRATLDDAPYREWWECWEEQGAVSLGRALNYDWMHLQFARL